MHFTPRDGRVGDLFGVLHRDGRYHLFYEHRSGGDAGWGCAVSDDLVIWREGAVAAAPGGPGCGSVVDGPSGPVLFHSGPGSGVRRATAAADLTGWLADPDQPVLGAAPEGFSDVRDPFVFAAPGGWRMLVAATAAGGGSAVLQYRSADLDDWSYDGVLTTAAGGQVDCPRLFELDGEWVLLVAGADASYAIGGYDGVAFRPRARGVFGRGRLGPAAPFVDAAGRRCVLARVGGSTWAGALSVPWILSVRGTSLLATPHPHLDRYLVTGVTGLTADAGELRDHGDLILRMPAGGETTVLADADIVEVTVEGVSGLGAARRAVPGEPGAHIARIAGSGRRHDYHRGDE
ncbi:Beta-fructofuranosidase, insoluble isoenzyme 1 [Actinoplanes sp. SE50]|uniref:glycoside hydrolase family 32 protein n=1 Tax=unclassified Actinoplanes TaxID=2626549 RepID=UPI00023ECAF0|nr:MULTISPECIES: glycoside hydrolase family 32 protein [unclassified Actinoplanes]AEV83736.1 Beta-fructofuranosidase, insoluble isoenzyme 1 [Actinoplanes sp. SE50/110]ATO82120.1 Beta-fructofuranosidase, insoluble isoenzyme 1 [Actinoplanes sp. SE50]SLL99527.1 beta-fructofuranosidase [Actinoplanes sp. SE50/110]